MNRKQIICTLVMAFSLFLGGSSEPSSAQTGTPSYYYEGVKFYYNGHEYDITDQVKLINSIMSCKPAGKYLVIDGHVGPKNGCYCIFNTETESFERDIVGSNLIWRGDDLSTAVYSNWCDVCSYDGTVLASFKLAPYEFIEDLQFTADGNQVKVMIFNRSSQPRVEMVKLKK
ncbi:MAG: hypothetical protein K6A35_08505 [bacterium]|nr:hypothetical protein [bacterium]